MFLIAIHHDVISSPLRHRDGNHLVRKFPSVPSARCTIVAFDGKGILILTRDAFFFGTQLRTIPHVGGVVDVRETIQQHAILNLDVAKFHAVPPVQIMRHLAHVFHASGHHQISVAAENGLAAEGNGFHPAGTHLVDSGAWNALPQARSHCSLTCRSLTDTRLQHIAHEHLVD